MPCSFSNNVSLLSALPGLNLGYDVVCREGVRAVSIVSVSPLTTGRPRCRLTSNRMDRQISPSVSGRSARTTYGRWLASSTTTCSIWECFIRGREREGFDSPQALKLRHAEETEIVEGGGKSQVRQDPIKRTRGFHVATMISSNRSESELNRKLSSGELQRRSGSPMIVAKTREVGADKAGRCHLGWGAEAAIQGRCFDKTLTGRCYTRQLCVCGLEVRLLSALWIGTQAQHRGSVAARSDCSAGSAL